MKQGWEIKKIKDICDKASSNIAQNKITDIHGDYPVYGASGFVQNINFYHRDTPYIGVIKDGSGVGRVNVYPAYSSLLGTLQYILPKDGYLLHYVAYALNSINLPSFATGAAIPHIYFKNYGETEIRVAPLIEQEKIVAELDCLSGIIEKKKQQLKELDNLAQSIFYEMFGDPVENDKGWDIYALSKNVKVKGRVGWKGYKKEDLRDSGPLAIGGGHLTDSGGIDLSSPVFLSMEKYLESPEIMIEVGDIILVQRGTIGKVGLIATDIGMATINPCVLILRPENLNAIYLLHYFLNQSTQTHLKTLIKGVAQPMITQQQVNGLLLPIPPLTLQQDFASKIEAIEKQKELIANSIKETETLFNSRMDYYFN